MPLDIIIIWNTVWYYTTIIICIYINKTKKVKKIVKKNYKNVNRKNKYYIFEKIISSYKSYNKKL